MENNLSNLNFEEADWAIRNGYATEEQAKAYVDLWNNGGKKFTKIKLVETQKRKHGVIFKYFSLKMIP